MSEQASALYPTASPAAVRWLATLQAALAALRPEFGPTDGPGAGPTGGPAGGPTVDPTGRPSTDRPGSKAGSRSSSGFGNPSAQGADSAGPRAAGPHPVDQNPADPQAIARELRAEYPEASEVPLDVLTETIRTHGTTVSGLSRAFHLAPATLLTALGRGHPLGELDPVVAAAAAREPGNRDLRPLLSSGTVTVQRHGGETTLVAATTVGRAAGPRKLVWPDRDDVWLCAVPPRPTPLETARRALERILPHTGVLDAHIRPAGPGTLHIGLRAVDPGADPDLVMGRLEGWRTAVEQLHRGEVAIVWEQA